MQCSKHTRKCNSHRDLSCFSTALGGYFSFGTEYATQLQKALPTAGEDIDSITEAFIQARYSRQQVDSSKADFVKAIWERIRRALQRIRNEKSATK